MQLPRVAAIGAVLASASTSAQPAPTEPRPAPAEPPPASAPAPAPTHPLVGTVTGDGVATPYAFNRKTQDTATLGVAAWF